MKNLIYKTLFTAIAIFALASSALAQVKTNDYNLAGFSDIKVSDSFEVTVVNGAAFNCKITVDEPYLDAIICNVEKGTLSIGINDKNVSKETKKLYKGKNAPVATFRAIVTVPEKIKGITLEDSAVLYEAQYVFSEHSCVITAEDNACVKSVDLDSQNIEINCEDRSNVFANVARADNLVINTAGGAVSSFKVSASTCTLNVGNSGTLTLDGQVSQLTVNAKGTSKTILNGTCSDALFCCEGSSKVNGINQILANAEVNMSSLCNLVVAAGNTLNVQSLKNSATLQYAGDPSIQIGSIVKSSMTRYNQ